jgi:hypothetical protein
MTDSDAAPRSTRPTLAGIAAMLAPHRLEVLGGFFADAEDASLPAGT